MLLNYGMILDFEGTYKGDIHPFRFAASLFKQNVSRTGDIISFISPVDIELGNDISIKSDNSINLILEIPDIEEFGAVTFQCLFHTQIAFILNSYISEKYGVQVQDEYIVINDSVETKRLSDTIIKMDKATGLIYYTLKVGELEGCSLQTDEEKQKRFMEEVIVAFYSLTKLLFFKTRLI